MPAVAGAVYSPADETVPPFADQVTALLEAPATEALNCNFAPIANEELAGVIETETAELLLEERAALGARTPPHPVVTITESAVTTTNENVRRRG